MSPGLKDEGSIRIYRLRESSLQYGGIKGRQGFLGKPEHEQLEEGRKGQAVVLLGWGARDHVESLNHTAYLLHSTRCPQAPGYESPAYSRFNSPGIQQPSQGKDALVPCASFAAKSHAAERQLYARKLGEFQLSPALPEELPNVSAYKSSAERLRLQVSQRTGSVSLRYSKPQFLLPAGCCLNKVLERMKPAILQACITLHFGV